MKTDGPHRRCPPHPLRTHWDGWPDLGGHATAVRHRAGDAIRGGHMTAARCRHKRLCWTFAVRWRVGPGGKVILRMVRALMVGGGGAECAAISAVHPRALFAPLLLVVHMRCYPPRRPRSRRHAPPWQSEREPVHLGTRRLQGDTKSARTGRRLQLPIHAPFNPHASKEQLRGRKISTKKGQKGANDEKDANTHARRTSGTWTRS